MKVEPLDRIMPALAEIGAVPLRHQEERGPSETTYVVYLRWRDRLIRAAWNVTDDLSVKLSTGPAGEPRLAQWKTIFAYTVPGFEQFDDDQKLDWVLAVPSGRDFPPFVAEHIRRLPPAFGA